MEYLNPVLTAVNVTHHCTFGEQNSLGTRMLGNMRTLACMKDRSGSPEITLSASALSSSSRWGFLKTHTHKQCWVSQDWNTFDFWRQNVACFNDKPNKNRTCIVHEFNNRANLREVLVLSAVDIRRFKVSSMWPLLALVSTLLMVNSYSSRSTPLHVSVYNKHTSNMLRKGQSTQWVTVAV